MTTLTRMLTLSYGTIAYVVFFGTILYAIGFVTGLPVPKTIDTGTTVPLAEAFIVNLVLLTLFAVQHSSMARKPFKQWLTKFISPAIERSTFVLIASLLLDLLFWQWRAVPTTVWDVSDMRYSVSLTALSLFGWTIVFASTFMINHFELFGLHQIVNYLRRRPIPKPEFKTPMLYKIVRHPIYLGFIVAFWATPTMTVGHLLFAAVTTAYILVGIWLEERDLIAMFGDDYRRYRQRVGMLLPWSRSQPSAGAMANPIRADVGKGA
jgi:protein-S-isoprenylcysteine O-methyltransferase Ste14